MTTQKPFKNVSIFKGWKNFITDNGIHVKAEIIGDGMYSIYTRNNDEKYYLFNGAIDTGLKRPSCKKIWELYLNDNE